MLGHLEFFASGQPGLGGGLIGIPSPEKRELVGEIRELGQLDMPVHANALTIALRRDVASLA